MSEWPRIVCTVRKSAPFSTICVAQEWRSMCGEAVRPDAADAVRTICQTRWRVSLRPPRAMKSKGEFLSRNFPRDARLFRRQYRSRLREILAERELRRFSQGHDTFFVAFAAHQHVSGFELKVFEFCVDNFRNSQGSRVEHFEHGAIANGQSGRDFGISRSGSAESRKRGGQGRLHFVARQSLGQNFPLPGRLDIQGWIVSDFLIEQQVAVKMTERGEFSAHAAPLHLMEKKLLKEIPHVRSLRGRQGTITFFQKFRELADIRAIGGYGKRSQSFLDFQIVEEVTEHARVRMRRHGNGGIDYAYYRTRLTVITRMPARYRDAG